MDVTIVKIIDKRTQPVVLVQPLNILYLLVAYSVQY